MITPGTYFGDGEGVGSDEGDGKRNNGFDGKWGGHFRMGYGIPTDSLQKALDALGTGLDDWWKKKHT